MDIYSVFRLWNTDDGAALLAELILDRPESLQQPGQQQQHQLTRHNGAQQDAKSAAAREGESLSLAALVSFCHAEALAPAVSCQQDDERLLHRSRPVALDAAVSNTTASGCQPQPERAEKQPAKAESPSQVKHSNMAGGLTAALLRSLAAVVNKTTVYPALGAPPTGPNDNLKASPERRGTGAEAGASAPVETTSTTRAKRCGEGEGIKGDSNNERKRLFEGVLKLLLELVVGKEGEKNQKPVGRDMGKECTDLIWDIVMSVLSDGWSEIRKMGASHARLLAAALGPGKARALYLTAAAGCKGALAAVEPENSRGWKRIHGFLLGMRASIEGATKTSAPSSGLSGNSIPHAEGDSHTAAGGKLDTRGSQDRLQEQQQRPPSFTGPAEFAGDLMLGCRAESDGTGWTRLDELGTDHEGSKPEHVASVAWCGAQIGPPPSVPDSSVPEELGKGLYTTPIDLSLPLPPRQSLPVQPPMLPISMLTSPIAAPSSPLDVVFACLSHRQAAVREAAVALLHTLAFTLGPGAALSLYERTLASLDKGRDEDGIAEVETSGGVVEDRLQRKVLDWGSRGGARLRRDRAGGLLAVLERLVPIVPSVRFGESWERVFSVLRFYAGHSQSSLRLAAGAVLLRIAKKGTTEASRLARDPLHTTCHNRVPERIILWALVCAWKDSASETHAPFYCPRKKEGPAERGSCVRNSDTSRQVDGAKAFDRRQMETETEIALLEEDAARKAAAETIQGLRSTYLSRAERQNRGLQVHTSPREAELARDDKGFKSAEQGDAPATASSDRSSRDYTMVSWEFREGALMVYEGVLKNFVACCMSDVVSGGHSRPDDNEVIPTPVVFDIAGAATAAAPVDTESMENYGWPAGLIDSTPPMSKILVSIKSQAENALIEAELRLRQRLAIFSNGELVGISVQPLQAVQGTPSGALELWRTASQLLPSIARAMTWCNPNALLAACKRTVHDDLEPAKGMPAQLLHLRRRALLSVATELVRASVRHARHIAELCVDAAADKTMNRTVTEPCDGQCLKETGTVTTAVAAPTAAGQLDLKSTCIPGDLEGLAHGSRVVPIDEDMVLAVTAQHRWGSSTDGIADSSREDMVRPLAAAQQSAENVSGPASSLVSPKDTKGGSTEVRAETTHTREIVARIVRDTLDLCRDAAPFIVQALEMVGSEGDIPTKIVDSGLEELAPGAVSSHRLATHTGATIGNDVVPLPRKARWVFSGVVEVLVLARTFRATTALLPFSNGQRAHVNQSFSPPIRSAGEKTRGNGETLPESADADQGPNVVVQQLEFLHAKAFSAPVPGGDASPSKTKSRHQENQRCTVAVAGEGGNRIAGGTREGEAKKWRVEKGESSACCDIHGGEEGDFPPDISKEAKGDEEPTTNFAVPFSWGSLPLVQATPAPRARGGGRDGALDGRGGETGVCAARGAGQSATTRFDETVRKAVQLDRLLSARVVHALPGYVGTLPPGIGIRLIPSLLRWLETRDDKVRWISVTPVESRASLLSAVGVALRLGREQTIAAREFLQDSLCGEGSGRGGYRAESTAATALAPEGKTDANNEPRKRQQRQLQAGSIARVTMTIMARMISNETLGASLFSQACLVSRDAILLSVSSNFASTESSTCDASDPEMDLACATGKGKCVGGISTGAGCHQEDGRHTAEEDNRSGDENYARQTLQAFHGEMGTAIGSDGGHHGNLATDSDANAREVGRVIITSLLSAVAEHLVRCFPDDSVCSSESQTPEERGASPPRRLQQTVETMTAAVESTATGPSQGKPMMANDRERESGSCDHDDDRGGGSEWDDWDDSDGDEGGGTNFQAKNNTAGGKARVTASSEEKYSAVAASAWALMSAADVVLNVTDKPTSAYPDSRRAERTENAGRVEVCERGRTSITKGDDLRVPPSLEAVFGELPIRNRQALAVAWRKGVPNSRGE